MSQEIVGRVEEQARLKKILYSNDAEFLAIYGRRRVGKTYLIRSFFSSQDCLFFQVSGILKAPMAMQLQEFKNAIEATFYQKFKATQLAPPKTWMEALEILHEAMINLSYGKTMVLFFDEFPWLAMKQSYLLQALDYYWNHYWSSMPKVKLIICGSAASWIIKNILNNKAGLHNRVTCRMRLNPFNLQDVQIYLKHRGIQYDAGQIIQLYLCMGGIPYYLKLIEKGLSATQNINQLCFQKEAPLLTEFNNLFASLFSHHEIHEKIIRLISEKREGVSREAIEEVLQLKGGRVSLRLKELEEAGFIATFLPWGKKRGLYYKLIDEYSLFYLTWIEPLRQGNQKWSEHYWEHMATSPAFRAWSGYAFEALCFKHIESIRKMLNIPASAIAYNWRYIGKESWESGAQIDLVFERSDGVVNICEIKYSQEIFVLTKALIEELKRKVMIYKSVTKTNKQIFISLITNQGIQDSKYEKDIDSWIKLEAIF